MTPTSPLWLEELMIKFRGAQRMPTSVESWENTRQAIEAHIKQELKDTIDRVIGEDLPMIQPLDNTMDPIQYEGNRLFRKGANWSKAEQRKTAQKILEEIKAAAQNYEQGTILTAPNCPCTCHTDRYFDGLHNESCRPDYSKPNNPYTHTTIPQATKEVTRFEVIDDTGRILVKYGVSVELSLQYDGNTLKVFLTKEGEQ